MNILNWLKHIGRMWDFYNMDYTDKNAVKNGAKCKGMSKRMTPKYGRHVDLTKDYYKDENGTIRRKTK